MAILAANISIYHTSSNPVTHKSFPFNFTTPPIGLATINLTFSKTDLRTPVCSINFDLKANTNETTYVLTAISEKLTGDYPYVSVVPMQYNENSWYQLGIGPRQRTFYHVWTYRAECRMYSWDTFTPQNFPLDVYKTHRVIVSLNNSLILKEINLNFELIPGFIASLEDFRILPPNELPSRYVGDAWVANSLSASFQIIMVREQNALLWLLMYTLAPSLCVYWVAVIVQLRGKYLIDRLKIYIGAMFAVFSYMFTIRNFTPSSLTYVELLLLSVVVVWGIAESARFYFEV